MKIALPVLLAGALLWGCARVPDPGARDVVRLSERLRTAQLQWGAGGTDAPDDFEPLRSKGRKHRRVGRLAMVRESMDREMRVSLLAPSGTRWRFPVTLTDDSVLRLGLGYVAPPGEEPGRIQFAVRLTEADHARHLLLEEEVAAVAADAWRDRELDLSAWGGQRVLLDLVTRAPAGERPVWGAWSAPEIVRRDAESQPWDVVLVVLDTLRADHLGSYGYSRPTSPALDALAATSIRFESAVSPAPWTRPAHRALFSGLNPSSKAGLVSLPLAQVLRRAGYRTGAITGGGQVDYEFGFAVGFEQYRVYDWIRELDAVTSWFRAARHRNRFLFLHTYEIHDPYVHREFAEGLPGGRISRYFNQNLWESLRAAGGLTEEEKRYVEALYDGDIAYTDRQLGELLGRLESSGDLDRAIVIVTSDHGEQLFEHNSWRHGQNLYDHQLLVPLIVRLPPPLAASLGVEGGRVVTEQVRLIDLYPTLLDLLEIPLPREVQGRSFLPLLRGESLPPEEALAESVSLKFVERKALRSLRYKYVHTFPANEEGARLYPEGVELFDLERDPGELDDVAEAFPDLVARLEARLQELIARQEVVDRFDELPDEIDPELRKQLEALGYVGN